MSLASDMNIGDRHDRKPVRFHQDDRRRGWFNLFPATVVDVNVVLIPAANTMVALHRHAKQGDYWFVARGSLLVGLAGDEGYQSPWNDTEILSEADHDVLEIPAGIWHGYRTLGPNTLLIYGITNRWNGADEERCDYASKGVIWCPLIR